ncbi:MAG TPA: HAD-IA family hydrolase [Candidatus Sulfotelmatobacter sp.]|nr:HAD-IA family hydrolase [Candidatus Sulfotelmatobacter sp.]
MTTIACKGLLIDMDGVLVDSTPAVARVWSRWALKHNMDPDYATQYAHGRTSLASIRELLPHADPAAHLSENAWMERAEIEDVADVVAFPGAKELLAALAPGQLTVVTSATRPLAEVRLRAAGLWEHVHHLVTASDIQRSKPDPEPYQQGAAALHLHPQLCVVIEDAPSGTRSGKTAGARVLAVRTTTDDQALLAAGADWIVNDCSSLRVYTDSRRAQLTLEFSSDEPPRRPKMR